MALAIGPTYLDHVCRSAELEGELARRAPVVGDHVDVVLPSRLEDKATGWPSGPRSVVDVARLNWPVRPNARAVFSFASPIAEVS